jgi:hypothetical protein
LGLPVPSGVSIEYDTLNETVVLRWEPADTSLIDGFNIYRSSNGRNFALYSDLPLPETTTTFSDSNVETGTVYEYRIVSRNRAGEESRFVDFESDSIEAVPSRLVTTTLNWSITENPASIFDTVTLIVRYSNPTRRIRKVEWYEGEYTGELCSPVKVKDDSSLSGFDTLQYQWKTHGDKLITLRSIDDAGMELTLQLMVNILLDPPTVMAGTDTAVGLNDTFFVHFSGSDIMGTIVQYRIDLDGNGTFDDSSSTEGTATGYTGSSDSGAITVIVEAEDDDGNTARDTMRCTILLFQPVLTLRGDTVISINDSFYVYYNATDSVGNVVGYRFDIDNDGQFDDSSTAPGMFFLKSSSIPETRYIVVQAEDDDGNRTSDSVRIMVVQGIPVANAGNPIVPAASGDTVTLKGRGVDRYGLGIVRYEWDIGNTSNFVECEKGITDVIIPDLSEPDSIVCIFRVTDDDDNVDQDTCIITIDQTE